MHPLNPLKKNRRFTAVTAFCIIAGLSGAFAAMAAKAPADAPDAIFVNGVIRTMEGPSDRVEAVAIRDGRILSTGSSAQILRLKTKGTRTIDLKGKTMLPGFIDAHGHISMLAALADMANAAPPPVGGVQDVPSLQTTLRTYIASRKIQPGEWVMGNGYDDAELAEHRHPTRHELDAISTDNPILLLHASGHLAVANTRALQMAGLFDNAANPPGGVIRKEADGQTAAGVLEESAMFKLASLVPQLSLDVRLANLKKAQAVYAGYGITTAQDGATSPADYAVLQEAAKRDQLFIDVGALLFFRAPWPKLDEMPIGKDYDRHLRILGLKLMLDGSPQGRTAWLKDPYYKAPEGRGLDYHGYSQLSDDELRQWLTRAADHDWQVFVHVNGDQAMQQLIDSVAAVSTANRKPLDRTIAIHSQVVRPDQLQRMKTLDIQPSFFVAHTFYWGDWHRDVTLGPVRASYISPVRDAINLGLIPTTHNDAPIVPPDMLRLVWSAVNRQTRSDKILGPDERVTPCEALLTVTRNAAWQIHEEASKGTIAPGKIADFVVLDVDPLTVKPETLDRLKVLATFKGGREVFSAAIGGTAQ